MVVERIQTYYLCPIVQEQLLDAMILLSSAGNFGYLGGNKCKQTCRHFVWHSHTMQFPCCQKNSVNVEVLCS